MTPFSFFAPAYEHFAQKFRTIVGSQNIWQAALVFELFKHPNQTLARQRGVDLDGQCFAIEVVQNIESAKAHATVQRVAHEVGRPHTIRRLRHEQWQRIAHWNALLRSTPKIELQQAVHAIHSFVIPQMPHAS